MATEPKTLQDAILYFSNADNCVAYLVARRWPNGVICPTCGRADVSYIPARRVWQCKTRHFKAQFSVKVGTIMEDSALSLDKWLMAIWMQSNCKNGISSWEIHRAIGITQKCAWHMMHRIRLALDDNPEGMFSGEVEADETFVGGKLKNMHKRKQEQLKQDGRKRRGIVGKAIVSGLLERNTKKARVKVMPTTRQFHLRTNIIENVEKGSMIYSDALKSYQNIDVDGFEHEFIDHTEEYVRGRVHTNGMENFWSLLKRALKGTYVSVEPFHLQAYCDEQAFRFNHRKMNDSQRFSLAVTQITGKRLTYAQLTGKIGEPELI